MERPLQPGGRMRLVLLAFPLSLALAACSGGGGADLEEGFEEIAPGLAGTIAGALFPASKPQLTQEHRTADCPDGGTVSVAGTVQRSATAAIFSGEAMATGCRVGGFAISGTAGVTASQTLTERQVILWRSRLTIEHGADLHDVTIGQLIAQLPARTGSCYRVVDLVIDGEDVEDLRGGDPVCLGP